MKKENLRFKNRYSGVKFLTLWMLVHLFLWGITQAISSTAKFSLHIFVADTINPFICLLEISENNWGSTCTILGLDFGLLIGQLISFLAAFLFGGLIAGFGEWYLVKKIFNISAKQRKLVVIVLIIVGLVTSFFVNFFAMFSGIINVAVAGVNHLIATFITGFFFGGLYGVFYGVVTLLIYYLNNTKEPLL